MKRENTNLDDERLSALLRQCRPSGELPPRFQGSVWRRIESASAPETGSLLENALAWLMRPRWALAGSVMLILAGATFGALDGAAVAKQSAQARYLASIDPQLFGH